MLEAIQNAYAFIDHLHVSVTGLVVAIVLFALAFLFAIREAASWFFKVDDLKRDISRLKEISLQLESEVRLIQGLINQTAHALQAGGVQPTQAGQTAQVLTSLQQVAQPQGESQAEAPVKATGPTLTAVTPSNAATPLFAIAETSEAPTQAPSEPQMKAAPAPSLAENEKAASLVKTGGFPIVH